jgi:hypothetical protein
MTNTNNTTLEAAAALASVGKTEEQLKAEAAAAERTLVLASYAKEVAAQNMRDATKCQATVYDSGRYGSFHGHSCSKTAKYHREEPLSNWDKDAPKVTRHYCGQHDPVTRAEKEAAKNAAERAERERRYAAQDRASRRSAAIGRLTHQLTTEQLEELGRVNPDILVNAAKESK